MFHWTWFLWQWGIIRIQWLLNLSILWIHVRPEPLAVTQCCITWKLLLLKLDSPVLRWGCRGQREPRGSQKGRWCWGPAASRDSGLSWWGWPFPQEEHIHKLPLWYQIHSCRTVHAVSFVFCQSAKSCFLWSLILCSMSNWSASTPFKELENWLVLKSTQGEFRISLSFASLDICCWLQEAWGEQQLLFHFCFDNSETPSLATTVLIMKLRNLNFLSTAHSHRL